MYYTVHRQLIYSSEEELAGCLESVTHLVQAVGFVSAKLPTLTNDRGEPLAWSAESLTRDPATSQLSLEMEGDETAPPLQRKLRRASLFCESDSCFCLLNICRCRCLRAGALLPRRPRLLPNIPRGAACMILIRQQLCASSRERPRLDG